MTEAEPRFDIAPNVGNHFAWIRTLLGLQRTLMAGVRTAVSLIGFGFTVAQFFQRLQGNVPEGFQVLGPNVPRNVGLVLIAAGVISLLMFTVQYHSTVVYLRGGQFAEIAAVTDRSMHKPTYLVAWAVMLIGVLAFGSVFMRF